MKSIVNIFIVSLLLCSSCKHELRPILYGKDNCEHCRMTVMDPQFAAEMLTSKGKTFTFDAEECLVRYIKVKGINDKDQYFVSDYMKPGSLIDATKAVYLHGDSIQSPMGGNLAAFRNERDADSVQQKLGGKILGWNELLKQK